jgi:hypothetical protein
MDAFFEEYCNSAHTATCRHVNNDGVSCHDCFAFVNAHFAASFNDSRNYVSRRAGGGFIKPSDLGSLRVPAAVLYYAQEIFCMVASAKIYRGATRIGIIAGCIIHAFNHENLHVSHTTIVDGLGIANKKALAGLQIIDLTLFYSNRPLYESLLDNNLTFGKCLANLQRRMGLVDPIPMDKYIALVRHPCRITTAAAVVVWLHIEKLSLPITLCEVARETNLSANTIKKVAARAGLRRPEPQSKISHPHI